MSVISLTWSNDPWRYDTPGVTRSILWEGFVVQVGLSLEWKSKGVKDASRASNAVDVLMKYFEQIDMHQIAVTTYIFAPRNKKNWSLTSSILALLINYDSLWQCNFKMFMLMLSEQ